jgi:lipopolysaccharide biosynthesis glycosyltransferase
MAAMVKRNLSVPHRFVCVTDHEIDGIETIPVDFSKHIPGTVYCRLMQHAPDYGERIGATRILSLDIDLVVTGSLDKLVSRTLYGLRPQNDS